MSFQKKWDDSKNKKHIVFFFLLALIYTNVFSQESVNPIELVGTIIENHSIEGQYRNAYGNYFIYGDIVANDTVEAYKQVNVINIEKDYYFLYKSNNVYFNPKTNSLNIKECKIEQFSYKEHSMKAIKKYEKMEYIFYFEENIAVMKTLKP